MSHVKEVSGNSELTLLLGTYFIYIRQDHLIGQFLEFRFFRNFPEFQHIKAEEKYKNIRMDHLCKKCQEHIANLEDADLVDFLDALVDELFEEPSEEEEGEDRQEVSEEEH